MMNDQLVRATVTAVDPVRNVCRCITTRGRIMRDVRWTGSHGGPGWRSTNESPCERDNVFITLCKDVNQWFIVSSEFVPFNRILSIPNVGLQVEDEDNLPESVKPIADYSSMKYRSVEFGPARPRDMKVGDQITTSELGGMFGILRNNTIVAKAGVMCQLLLSPLGNLARMVSRSYEQFTDHDTTVKASTRGLIYGIHKVFANIVDSRANKPALLTVTGDVQKGMILGEGYAQMTASQHADAVAAANSNAALAGAVYHQCINSITKDDWPSRVVTKFRHGGELIKISNDDASSTTTEESTVSKKRIVVSGGDGSSFEINETSAHIDVAGDNTIDVVKGAITISCQGKGVVTVVGGKVTIQAPDGMDVITPLAKFSGGIQVAGFSALMGGANVG